mgnify:CR=1 FL=1
MKRVLIISASPRKNGNSDILCDRFAKGAAESGHKVEKIFLASENIVAVVCATPRTNAFKKMIWQKFLTKW